MDGMVAAKLADIAQSKVGEYSQVAAVLLLRHTEAVGAAAQAQAAWFMLYTINRK